MARRKPKQPSRDEVWAALAAERGGELVRNRRGGLKRVRIPLAPWLAVLDEYVESSGHSHHTYTRMRALYRARDDFRFRVYPRSVFSGLGIFFGMQALRIGHPVIDGRWIVKSNSEGRVRSLLLLPEVVRALQAAGQGRFETKPLRRGAPPGTNQLHLQLSGQVKDAVQLGAMIDLFGVSLEQLARIGAAARESVGVEPK
jgi:hypothetical protein